MELSIVCSHLQRPMFLLCSKNQNIKVTMLATFSSLGSSEVKAPALLSLVFMV